MAIPTYLPAPEQPGWPNLPDQGIPLVNAAALGTSMRLQAENIKGKLAQLAIRNEELLANEGLKEKYYNIALEKVGLQADHNAFMADYEARQLRDREGWNRESRDIAWERADIADRNARTSAEREKLANDRANTMVDVRNKINERDAAYAELKRKAYSGEGPAIGTPGFALQKAVIDTKYSGLNQYPGGDTVPKGLEQEHERAQRESDRALDRARKKLEESIRIATGGKGGINPLDLAGDLPLGTDHVPSDQAWVAHDPIRKRFLTPDEVKNYPEKLRKYLDFTTMSKANWKILQDSAKEIIFPDGKPRTLANTPDPYSGPSGDWVTLKAVNGDTVQVPSSEVPRLIRGGQYRYP